MKFARSWLAAIVVFLALDAVWLGLVAGSLYTRILGGIMLEGGFRILPAVAFYALQVTGIVVFVVPRARQSHGLGAAAAFGAVFGLCTYGTYDLTNQAVLRVWTTELTLIDMTWGAVVTAAASVAAVWADRRR